MAKDYLNWDDIPDSQFLPTGWYLAKWAKCQDGKTAKDRRMVSCSWVVQEPVQYKGLFVNENLVVGGEDEDPMSDNYKMSVVDENQGTRALKGMLVKASVKPAGSKPTLADLCAAAVGNVLMLRVQYGEEAAVNRDGTPNEYAGQPRNRVRNWASIGEREPAVDVKAGDGKAAGKQAGKAAEVPCPRCGESFPLAAIGMHMTECGQASGDELPF